MNQQQTDSIRRYQDGSIDYTWYASAGMRARSRQFSKFASSLTGTPAVFVRVLPILTALTLLPLLVHGLG